MPPVLGPVSPSPMRLKSRAGASGSARSPSHSASTDSSSPRRNSSTSDRVVAEAPLLDHRHQRGVRLRLVLGDHHALAGREPVGLDHRGVGGDRRHPLLDRADDPVPAGRDPGRLHDLLGERLRALEPRGLALGPEHRHALGLELVGEPGHERRLRPDDDEVDARLRRGGGQRHRVADVGVEPLRLRADARVARRAQQLRLLRRAGERADDRVLAPARADDEDPHLQSDAMKSSIGIAASDS